MVIRTNTSALATQIREAVEKAQRDSLLLDGRAYDESHWTAVFDALVELEARAAGRRKKPGVDPCTARQADASLEASPLTLGELEVNETLAGEGVVARPRDYMRLVQVIRLQHAALEQADEEPVIGVA